MKNQLVSFAKFLVFQASGYTALGFLIHFGLSEGAYLAWFLVFILFVSTVMSWILARDL